MGEPTVKRLRIAYDARIPTARWGPLFHVFRLERPDVRFDWQAAGFPVAGRSLLEDADVGVFLQPPSDPGLRALTLDASPMVVVMAVGHRLAQRDILTISDVLDEPFLGGPRLHPEWAAFWTLDAHRDGPAKRSGDAVDDAAAALDVVAAGQAIATAPDWVAWGLSHPGVVSLALGDAPPVASRMVWRADEDEPAVLSLVDLATAWTADARPRDGRGNRRPRRRRDPPSRRPRG
jgi:DNA-binding transcriptional LysR family regulator